MTLPRLLLPALLLAALPSCGETTQDEPAPRHWLRRFGTPEKDYVGALGLLADSRLVVVGGSEGRLELDGNSFEPDQLFTASFDRTGHVTRAVADGGDVRWLLPGGDFVSSGGGALSESPQPSFVQRSRLTANRSGVGTRAGMRRARYGTSARTRTEMS